MYDSRGDLTFRTVVWKGDIDNMGVVIHDGAGERVKVDFGDRKPSGPHYDGGIGDYVDRGELEDVTDTYNLAVTWGLVEEEDEDE
jgi:hypothetical protein